MTADPNSLESHLEELLRTNPTVMRVLKAAPQLRLPDWYLGAGCITQTVWNHLHGFEPAFGVKDCDLIYFDGSDLSYEAEDQYIQQARRLFDGGGLPVEVRNQARVHLWYEQHFGYGIAPHSSAEQAIYTWPTTATAVGVRLQNGEMEICAPYGLQDLFELIVRPVKVQVTREIYERKVDRWKRLWPKLRVVPWDDNTSVGRARCE